MATAGTTTKDFETAVVGGATGGVETAPDTGDDAADATPPVAPTCAVVLDDDVVGDVSPAGVDCVGVACRDVVERPADCGSTAGVVTLAPFAAETFVEPVPSVEALVSAVEEPSCVVVPDPSAWCAVSPSSWRVVAEDEPDPLSAWATPPPAANAAPTPRVMAPAPSQDDTANVRRSPRRTCVPTFVPAR